MFLFNSYCSTVAKTQYKSPSFTVKGGLESERHTAGKGAESGPVRWTGSPAFHSTGVHSHSCSPLAVTVLLELN